MTTPAPKPPVLASDIPPEWTDMIRDMLAIQHHPVKACGESPRILVQSHTTKVWLPLMLPGRGTQFTDFDQRNVVLRRIQE